VGAVGNPSQLSRDGGGVFFVSRIGGEAYAKVFDADVVQEAQKRGAWAFPADTAFVLVRYRIDKNALAVS
jgi:hypothetical protein